MFNQFKGIEAEREVKESRGNGLKSILEIGDRVINDFYCYYFHKDIYKKVYYDLRWKLADIDYSAEDIKSFVLIKSMLGDGNEYHTPLGYYTGALLQILTEKNRKKGIKTKITDGQTLH